MLLAPALLAAILSADPAPPDAEPATVASARLLALLESVEATMVDTAYQHRTTVKRREGVFRWDCSGMMTWLLARAAPRAREGLDRERPVAATYYHAIARAPTRGSRGAWRRIADVRELRPGDVFAWLRPPDWPRGGNTGHVGVVVEAPEPAPDVEGAWTVRVADASRYTHQGDTRDPDGDGGLGRGTILFVADAEGAPIAYGWRGTDTRFVHETSIVLGRVVR
jgi:hypothetical protein